MKFTIFLRKFTDSNADLFGPGRIRLFANTLRGMGLLPRYSDPCQAEQIALFICCLTYLRGTYREEDIKACISQIQIESDIHPAHTLNTMTRLFSDSDAADTIKAVYCIASSGPHCHSVLYAADQAQDLIFGTEEGLYTGTGKITVLSQHFIRQVATLIEQPHSALHYINH